MILVFLLLIANALRLASAHGMSTMQCPNGYYLSRFGSAYDGSERLYKFGCSQFSNSLLSLDEICTTTEAASTENGDMYLSCEGDQYTAGVEIIEDVGRAGVDTWQLLCCKSESIRVRTDDCIDTKFINDVRRSSTFSSSAQVIRRWQAMQEDGWVNVNPRISDKDMFLRDKRWWLQLCPVDIRQTHNVSQSGSATRFKRQVPWSWSRRRFPSSVEEYNPIFSKQLHAGDEGRRKLYDHQVIHFVGNHLPTSTSTTTTVTSTTTVSPTSPSTFLGTTTQSVNNLIVGTSRAANRRVNLNGILPGVLKFNERNKDTASTHGSASKRSSSAGQRIIEAVDYYDMYDGSTDSQHDSNGRTRGKGETRGLLSEVSDLIQNLQDGLMLAQAAMPKASSSASGKNFHFKLAITPPPPTTGYKGNILFSSDDSLQIGPFVQQDREERIFRVPTGSGSQSNKLSTKSPSGSGEPKKKEVNTIESMLQLVGLCQRHEDL